MSSTREIDAFDTLVGIFTTYFTRALIWFGIMIAGTAIGLLGLWFHQGVVEFLKGSGAKFLAQANYANTAHAFVDLPQYWAELCIASFTHPVGIFCVIITVIGSMMFVATDLKTEPLFFIHLMSAPWASMAIAPDLPLFGLPLWFVWSGGWGFLWYKRWKDGEDRVRKEEEYASATGYRFSMLALERPSFPEIRFKDPNPVSEPLRLPSSEELRTSLNLPEPPPDIDTANLR